ncbi:hypothetical protein P43SY_004296 [Pythium insidiosum]|uniref:HTH CENPB-type domain-containing protein n=1 Tax=Pythium insidiosum TaxID=114742 RepID=A0AAD5Q7Y0_PYTIN|nr:hypothetical protein P43SY_004296 [Pythium insidiosum]
MPRGQVVLGRAHGLQKGNLTHQQRLAIVRKKDDEPRWTQEDLARWAKKQFGLLRQPTQSTISNILRSRERLETLTTSLGAKSVRPVRHPELDAALLLWLRALQSQPAVIPGEQIREKALELAQLCGYTDDMTYSNGWMRSYLTRHHFEFRRNQIDPRPTVSFPELHAIVSQYAPQDVFTLVTMNLWYRMEPRKASAGRRSVMEDDDGEPSLTLGLPVNMTGTEKWSPVFVARTKQPPSFQGRSAFQWQYVEYFHNGVAQMTSTIFEAWVRRLNQRLMTVNRRVLLVLDSSPSFHVMQLSHVRVVVHEDSETINLVPLTSTITTAFKAHYRKRQLSAAIDRAEAGESNRYAVSQLKAMRWIDQAWTELPSSCVQHAWLSVGLGSDASHAHAVAAQAQEHLDAMHHAITEQLEQLDVPGRIKSHDVVVPRGEDDMPHYVYNDFTVIRVVNAMLHDSESSSDDDDLVQSGELFLESELAGNSTDQFRQAMVHKLELFRGVIHCLDEECPPSDELTTVLSFLRRRQAVLRSDLQHHIRESAAKQPDGSLAPAPSAGALPVAPLASADPSPALVNASNNSAATSAHAADPQGGAIALL